jgi:UDP-N-acetylglucosamine 2-epimerase
MQPSPANPADRGFPRPDRTLVYDGYAAQHLITAGHFPPEAIAITGSPALDALVASVSRVDADERARIRVALDAQGRAEDAVPFVLLVTKYTQVRDVLPDLLAAVAALRSVRLVIKPHPAETAEPYRLAAEAAGVRDVIIAPPAIDLARLLAVARVLVTVNSTVAIDAISLGVPACVIGLPNNLSPFVEAGVMAGAGARAGADDLAQRLGSLLHDDAQREALLARGRAFAARYAITPDGRAAERAADVMTGIMTGSRVGRAS